MVVCVYYLSLYNIPYKTIKNKKATLFDSIPQSYLTWHKMAVLVEFISRESYRI